MYTITLADGTKLENLDFSGNNYIAQEIIKDSVFEGNLSKVTISDGKITNTYHDMVLIQNTTYGDGHSWFILAEKTQAQKDREEYEQTITDLQMALVEMFEISTGGM